MNIMFLKILETDHFLSISIQISGQAMVRLLKHFVYRAVRQSLFVPYALCRNKVSSNTFYEIILLTQSPSEF